MKNFRYDIAIITLFGFFIIWLLFIKSGNSLAVIILNNQPVIFQLIPIVFLFIVILICLRHHVSFNFSIGSLFSLFGLLITILFFMFQGSYDAISRIEALQIITSDNCESSKAIEELDSQKIQDPPKLFSYEIYNQNIPFILNYFHDMQFVGLTLRGITNMEIANRINEQMIIPSTNIELNKKLIHSAKNIHKIVCDEMEPVFLSKTAPLTESSLGLVLYKLFIDYWKM